MSAIPRRSAALLVAMLALAACSPADPELWYSRVEGDVLDQDAAPVGGTNILVFWTAALGASHAQREACTWIAGTTTNQLGHYVISGDPSRMKVMDPVFHREMKVGAPTILVFKRGMEWDRSRDELSENSRLVKEGVRSAGRLSSQAAVVTVRFTSRMQASHDSPHDRLRKLAAYSWPKPYCSTYDDLAGIRAYYEAIAAEARAIASTPEDQEFVEALAARAATPVGPGAEANMQPLPRLKIIHTH